MTRIRVLAVLAALTVLSPAWGANPPPRVPSQVVEKQVAKLTSKVQWHSSLDEATAQAQKEHKLVFWLHALGELDGTC
jgi:hypothetical protein